MQTPPTEPVRSRIFDGLTADARKAWLDAARSREVARGAVVARQGEPATDLYLVASGFLKVVQGTADGHELIVRFVGPGEPFGGVVALDGATYPVTAMAVESTRLLSWNLGTLTPLLASSPQGTVDRARGAAARACAAAADAPVRPSRRRRQHRAGALTDTTGTCRPHGHDALHGQPHVVAVDHRGHPRGGRSTRGHPGSGEVREGGKVGPLLLPASLGYGRIGFRGSISSRLAAW
jgi:CRP-like cAMP-binding protein